MVPAHTLRFGQQRLLTALRRTAGPDARLGYGFVLHARRRGRRLVLGIITPSGESLPLTPRLLAALSGQPLWLFGTAPMSLEAGMPVAGSARAADPAESPLASVRMEVQGLDRYVPGAQQIVDLDASVIADALVQPLVVLTNRRPEPWPA